MENDEARKAIQQVQVEAATEQAAARGELEELRAVAHRARRVSGVLREQASEQTDRARGIVDRDQETRDRARDVAEREDDLDERI
jgi:hypothetical protein